MAIEPLTVRIPVRGEVLVRIDGIPDYHKVGDFEQSIPIQFTTDGIIGATIFKFTEKMMEEAIGPKIREEGVGTPTPQPPSKWEVAVDAIVEMLEKDLDLDKRRGQSIAEGIAANLNAHGCLK